LSRELVRIALDAQDGFKWDASRPPFPGLLVFQEEEANDLLRPRRRHPAPIGKPLQDEDFVHSEAFSPDGARVVTPSWDKTARVWDEATGAPNIIAIACQILGSNHDTAGLSTRYGFDVKIRSARATRQRPTPRI
jgi:WD40 repeat protein